jgi:hypothetical protein
MSKNHNRTDLSTRGITGPLLLNAPDVPARRPVIALEAPGMAVAPGPKYRTSGPATVKLAYAGGAL